MKKISSAIVIILSLFISIPVFASSLKEDIYTSKPEALYTNNITGYGVYIEDNANYLSEEEESKLVESMKSITSFGNVSFFSYTDEHDRSNIAKATKRFDLVKFGPNVSSIVFSVNPYDIYIYSEGDMYDIIDKKYAYTITDNIYKEAKDDNMYNCSVHCFGMINDVLDGRKIAQPMKYICNTLLGIMMSILICFIYVHKRSIIPITAENDIVRAVKKKLQNTDKKMEFIVTTKIYSPQSSSSHSSYHGGRSHHSGGGHHGGGHHGGGGGHHR